LAVEVPILSPVYDPGPFETAIAEISLYLISEFKIAWSIIQESLDEWDFSRWS